MSRLFNLQRLAAAFLLTLAFIQGAQAQAVTDALGRKVQVPDHVQRIILGESRLIGAVALLDRDDPFGRIVGWQNDLHKLDPAGFAAYQARFPKIVNIPLIGEASEQSVSAEKVLSLKPDLAIFSVSGHGPTEHSPVADALIQAGVAVLFVDFRIHPVAGTHASLTAMGQALGREKEAKAYLDFYDEHLKRITDVVGNPADAQRPTVFLELLAGVWQAPGHTTGQSGMGEIIHLVGGRNIAAGVIPGALGDISVEYALKADPDLYVVTGNHAPGLVLGAGVDEKTAQASLDKVLQRPEFAGLRAVHDGHVHGLWHDFYNSPFDILAIEALAKWVNPQALASLDPAQTQSEINQQFLKVPLQGQYWVDKAK
ncbi:ABC transporter substrate-binding protein [Pseudomonas sp. dw_358]|uniref:ABC transporter substrate-binding protein n=1 Tax=Pseudomonas sp. dw_358 TaxID=2720083 RepID=UPI001BD1E81C|nr:ABC transporter substrate-binding protein [Pseudomonas sp. dw_358]